MAAYLTQHVSPAWHWLVYSGVAVFQLVLVLVFVLVSVAFFVWLERKLSARIQDRLGPTRTGGRFGWLQTPADGIKLLCKEDIIPAAADQMLFRLAPYISFCAAFAVFLAIPLADGWVPLRMNVALFFVLAVSGLEIFGVILAGYSSGSKYSLYGSIREAAQVVSYEVPLVLCAVIPVLITGSMDLVDIGNRQSGWFWNWNVFHDPFTFIAFFVFFVGAMAHTNRAPFDLPEAESELVAGFMTEYTGFRWVVFFLSEYTTMLGISALTAILFFGGWNGPVPIGALLRLTPEAHPLLGFVGNLLGFVVFVGKCYFGIMLMMWARWTLPRLRIDQVMTTCLKYLIPIASAMLLGVTLWMYFLPCGISGAISRRSAEEAERPTSATVAADLPREGR